MLEGKKEGHYPEQFIGKNCMLSESKILLFFFLIIIVSTELLKSYWVYHSVKLLTCGHWAV